ncbi:PepSY domain-containing protein [Bordetella genomosp. 13]|uniref:Peptidase n=1 Tax=Bordetella genomosp. 13 TaxID=463040 RepID=A0A1W6ZF80_9BORD|nr:PepSY domain-containing protein [Bordetella genomosp. 13]ARP95989.1 peptidase [Bordetella genomosp. 13]
MDIGARARRLTYLLHRWTGVFGCVLMALWFISGVVMLYVGYPKLTPWERLAALPALQPSACCVAPHALTHGGDEAVLTSIRGQPHYVAPDARGVPRAYAADTGLPAGPVGMQQALAAARAFAPHARATDGDTVWEDRWTHARGLDPHRPLHRVLLQGGAGGALYVSSATGQVVLDAPRAQQRWNYLGAWLHWLYMFRVQSVDPVWSWTVIVLSAAGTLSALTGIVVGTWRWRFRGRYRSGSRTPYREGWMRWHHVAGLLFGGALFAWIFSGLMSMNPIDAFSPAHGRPDLSAYRGGAQNEEPLRARPVDILQALRDAGFRPVELQWRRIGGQPYVLAYDAAADSRLVWQANDGLVVAAHWTPQQVMPAARRLFGAAVVSSYVLDGYDDYYYGRQSEAMNGARPRGLPALRLDFADAGRTRVYIDLRTGEVAASLDRHQRVGRWLFNFLHSWDTPALLRQGWLRDAVLIALSAGGFAVSMTGVVIGWRRLRAWLGARSRTTRRLPPA